MGRIFQKTNTTTMPVLNQSISFENGQVVLTTLSLESQSLKVNVNHYDSLFFGSVGTLVHLSQLQYDSFSQVLKERNLPLWSLEEYKASLTSTGGRNRLMAWSKKNNLNLTEQDCIDIHNRKSEIFQQNMRIGTLNVRPGVIELLEECKKNGVKTAWVTTTPAGNVEAQFDGMRGLSKDAFDCYISHADEEKYGRGKPTADPYLYVMRQLRVRNPLVFEDSEISMKAVTAANLDCIAIPNNWCTTHNYTNAICTVTEPSDLFKKTELDEQESSKLSELLAKVQITA